MVVDVNKLAELVELDSLPDGLRQAIESKKDEILQELRTKGEVVIAGPNGKQFRLQAKGTIGKTKTATA
jgi:hypothetical protein